MADAETTTLRSHDGLRLHALRWRTRQPAKACVLIVHGISEHSGRYRHVADFLTDHGYTVYSLDYRGHGRSEGERANVGEFALPVEDIKVCHDWLAAEEPGFPVYILGHSQGTLITLKYALRYPETISGVLLSATMIGMARLATPLVWLANALNAIAPRAKLIPLDTSTISRDPAVVEAAAKDPLQHHERLTPHIIHAMIHESRAVLAQLPALTKPIMIMHGTADRLVPPNGSQLVYDHVGSTDKQIIWYDGLYHELCNEPEQEQVLHDIVTWLDDHFA
jgi:acylglycerol lipase